MMTSNSIMSLTEKDAVCVFIVNDKNEVLLYRRINTWYEPNKLALVGGLVDEGENPEQAAVRESKEETTLEINPVSLTFLTTVEDVRKDILYKIHYFLTQDFHGTPRNVEPDRCAELVWHPLTSLPNDTIEIIKNLTEKYVTSR
jgi:ADP-ribose pyrophosphatase YjhB (NUDIX family)